MKKLVLVALMLLAPVAASAEDSSIWAELPNENGDVHYARWEDLRAGRSSQTDARIWLKTVYSNERTTKFDKKFEKSRTLYSVNCVAKTYTLITALLDSRDGQSTSLPGRGEVEFIVPDSPMETITRLLCADKPQP